MIGFGTEKLEEVTKEKFPELSVSRIDLDTIRRKGELRRLLGDFTKGKTDVLVGTQIIAKGLDFENVGVVGVVLADLGLNLPDFRSLERTFALITQVSGRAGRRKERGEVVVQTFQPENYAVKLGSLGDYDGFFEEELHMRKLLGYPPFSEFVQLLISGKDEGKAASGADVIAYRLRELKSGNAVIGPSRAPVAKISGNYRYMIYVKIFAECKHEYWQTLREMVDEVNLDGKNGYMLGVDVNPYSFM
jgi:primosomal protein N' (replication factor Y)